MSTYKSPVESWWVLPGFKIEVMATGLDLPVNLAFVPKHGSETTAPLLYVTELYGQVKVITNDWKVHTYADNLLNYEPRDRRINTVFCTRVISKGGTEC